MERNGPAAAGIAREALEDAIRRAHGEIDEERLAAIVDVVSATARPLPLGANV